MPKKFADLGLSSEIIDALSEQGITEPFPIQELAIEDALAGKDVCGKAKTGSGKTFAFGLPIIDRMPKAKPGRPVALALVPTRELALQIHDELAPLAKRIDRNVLAVYGGSNIETQIKAIKNGVDMIAATPGRLIDLIERKEVSLEDIEHVAVDEADRMADMGFMPQVEWILRHVPGNHQTLLFSATLDGAVNKLITRYQHEPSMFEVESETVTVDEMVHRFIKVHEMDKVKVAANLVDNSNRTLIFLRTKFGCDRLVQKLDKEGIRSEAIHGDLRQSAREKALSRFSEGDLQALVATDVAARGIHVDDVDVVLHYDPPQDHKAYLHRSGRTARAGQKGMAVSLMLYNQEMEIKLLMKRLDLTQPLVEMFSNDPRLEDLRAWDPHEG